MTNMHLLGNIWWWEVNNWMSLDPDVWWTDSFVQHLTDLVWYKRFIEVDIDKTWPTDFQLNGEMENTLKRLILLISYKMSVCKQIKLAELYYTFDRKKMYMSMW